MLMFHSDTKNLGNGKMYWKGWRGKYVPTTGEVCDLILKYACSPCMWGAGIRKKENFRYAEWIGLDFDEGMTLETAKATFKPYMHVIATTKSHGIEKNGVTCDRFRVILKTKDRIKNRDDYEATVESLIREHGADKACKDAARFFWPCKEIIVSKYFGQTIRVIDSSQVKKKIEAYRERRRKKFQQMHKNGSLPDYIVNKLRFGVSSNRNDACYSVAAALAELGRSEEDCFSMIFNSSIPIDRTDNVEKEVREAVGRGFRKGSQKYNPQWNCSGRSNERGDP